MAPPSTGDTNVIRRSIYQNSNTMVELLIKSKEPRGRTLTGGSTGARSVAASEPPWPAAVPLRRDGRPLSATAHQLPLRPRTGRSLPNFQPAAQQQGRGTSPGVLPAGRENRPPAVRGARGGGGHRQVPSRVPPVRGQVMQQQGHGTVPGRQPPAGPAGELEGEEMENGTSHEFRLWTQQISRLVQDIRKRPATAHLRPLLTKLEDTVRVPPVPPSAPLQPGGGGHDLLRARLEEIQRENEELQSKFQTLSAAMREYQQQRRTAGGLSTGDGAGDRAGAGLSGEKELTEAKHQLAKYKKYAKELRKTKENLLNTIQTLEESHATELKSLKEEHETQMAQVLAQFTSETEMLVSFRADAEAVQRSLAQRVRENSDLQRALAERDAELERLAALNQTLHELALNRLQQLPSSDLPSLNQLMTKLQSPSAGGCTSVPGEQGAGDGAARSAWLPRDVSLGSLDVTEPLPPRPFPGDWADLSLASLAGAAEEGGKGQTGEGERPRGAAGEPPPPPPPPKEPPALPTTTSSVHQRLVTDSGAEALPRPHQREPSIGGTNRRLFGDGDQLSGGAGAEVPNSARRSDPVQDKSGRGDQVPDRRDYDNQISGRSNGRNDQISDGPGRNDKISDDAEQNDEISASAACGGPLPTSGRMVGPAPSSSAPDHDVPLAGGGEGDAAPVGCRLSEDGFQRSLARLTERLSDLQQGISQVTAAQALTP